MLAVRRDGAAVVSDHYGIRVAFPPVQPLYFDQQQQHFSESTTNADDGAITDADPLGRSLVCHLDTDSNSNNNLNNSASELLLLRHIDCGPHDGLIAGAAGSAGVLIWKLPDLSQGVASTAAPYNLAPIGRLDLEDASVVAFSPHSHALIAAGSPRDDIVLCDLRDPAVISSVSAAAKSSSVGGNSGVQSVQSVQSIRSDASSSGMAGGLSAYASGIASMSMSGGLGAIASRGKPTGSAGIAVGGKGAAPGSGSRSRASSGSLPRFQSLSRMRGWAGGASRLAWNRQNAHLLASSHQGEIRLWDTRMTSSGPFSGSSGNAGSASVSAGRGAVALITGHMSPIVSMDWGYARSHEMITAGADSLLKRWDLAGAAGGYRGSSNASTYRGSFNGATNESMLSPRAAAQLGVMFSQASFAPFGSDAVVLTVPHANSIVGAPAPSAREPEAATTNPALWRWERPEDSFANHAPSVMRPVQVFAGNPTAVSCVQWRIDDDGRSGPGSFFDDAGNVNAGAETACLYSLTTGGMLKAWAVDSSVSEVGRPVEDAFGLSGDDDDFDDGVLSRISSNNGSSARGNTAPVSGRSVQPWPRMCGAVFSNTRLIIFTASRVMLNTNKNRSRYEDGHSGQGDARSKTRTYAQFLRAHAELREAADSPRRVEMGIFAQHRNRPSIFALENPLEFWNNDVVVTDLSGYSTVLSTFNISILDCTRMFTFDFAVSKCSRLPDRTHSSSTETNTESLRLHLREVCAHNRAIARRFQPARPDLEKFWSVLIILVSRRDLGPRPSNQSGLRVWWHSSAVESLCEHFAQSHDVQTLALVSCILDALGDKTEPYVQTTRDTYRRSYADILVSYNLEQHATELLKWNRRESVPLVVTGVTFENACTSCGNLIVRRFGSSNKRSICRSCNKQAFRCGVCHLFTRGLSLFCLSCGHGGCSNHMRDWFSDVAAVCPTGCGCECLFNFDQL